MATLCLGAYRSDRRYRNKDAISPLSFPPIFKTLLLLQRRELRKHPDLALRNLYFTVFKSYMFPQAPGVQ
jgi:hypothetical protein